MESKTRNPAEDDPDAPPSEEERALSDRLRDALADASARHGDADFARALAVAHTPREIDEGEHRIIIERAVARGESARLARRRGVVVRLTFGVAAAAALAAGVAFVLRAPPPASMPTELATTRSTQPLFGSDKFPTTGGECPGVDDRDRGRAPVGARRVSGAREERLADVRRE
jgi:hypothetical protein